jgi:hypothetical protein
MGSASAGCSNFDHLLENIDMGACNSFKLADIFQHLAKFGQPGSWSTAVRPISMLLCPANAFRACILMAAVIAASVLFPVLSPAEEAESSCRLLTDTECTIYREALRHSHSPEERARLYQYHAQLVREREALCPCERMTVQAWLDGSGDH